MTILFVLILCAAVFGLYRLISPSSRFHHDDNEFKQAGVRVVFANNQISISGKTYNVSDVHGIESRKVSSITTDVFIKVDDFNKPIHTVKIIGINNAGDKFIQRLSTALRKAGGPSFY